MTDNKQHPQQWKNLPDETPNLNQPIPQAPPFTDKNMDEVHEKESLRDAERLKDPNQSSAPGSTTDNDLDEEAPNDAGNLDIYNDDADDEPLDDASQSKQNDDNQRGSSGLVGTHDLGESVNPDEVLNKKL